MRRVLLPTLLLLAAAGTAPAQRAPTPMAQVYKLSAFLDDRDRAILGVTTQSDGKRDTLGLLIVSVMADSPAEKAGLEEGNRIASINGVSLKLARADAGESDMSGVMSNRLRREMNKLKPGDEASLEVWSGGRYRTVRVKTVSAEELRPRRTRADEHEPAALGISLSSSGSKRDTLGVFVSGVTEDGPAEKAGIVEGDRIASINGVDLKTPKEDLGDGWASSNRINRLQREIGKLAPGQTADLVVMSGGRSRTVKVTTVRARDLKHSGGFSYRVGDGVSMFTMPGAFALPPGKRILVNPKVRIYDDHDAHFEWERLEQSLEEIGPKVRRELERELPKIRLELERELPKAVDEVRRSLKELDLPAIKKSVVRSVII